MLKFLSGWFHRLFTRVSFRGYVGNLPVWVEIIEDGRFVIFGENPFQILSFAPKPKAGARKTRNGFRIGPVWYDQLDREFYAPSEHELLNILRHKVRVL